MLAVFFFYFVKICIFAADLDLKYKMKELFIKMSQIAATVAVVTGFFYWLIHYLLCTNGNAFGNLQIWTFRIAIIAAATWSMLLFKKRNQFFMSIPQGFAIGMLSSLFVGAIIAANTFATREYIYPTYNQELRNIVKANFNRERDPEDSSKAKWKPEQIEVQVNERWATFFTTKGGMAIDMFGAIAIGFLTSATVCFMARRVKTEKQNKLNT